MAKISTHNHWDKLKECFVGIADYAMLPTMNLSTRAFSYADYDYEKIKNLEGPHTKKVIDEANEDLEILSTTLQSCGVKVHRPQVINHSKKFSSPDWTTTGWYSYCPRDLLLPLDNIIIDCPSPMRSRQYETLAYRDFLYDAVNDGVQWIAAPKPRLLDDLYQFNNLNDPTTLNKEIIFDAPNIVKLGDDLLYQVSNSGTLLGGQWLKTILEPLGYKLHIAEKFYTYSHFDSTVIPLKPGLVLFNGARITPDRYPPIFETWDKIFFPKEQIIDNGSALPEGISPCSPYIGLNLLVVEPGLVICDKNQTYLRKALAKHNIETIGLELRHARTLSGGFHCTTLDTIREGKRESYF